jgi:hypothetical protein
LGSKYSVIDFTIVEHRFVISIDEYQAILLLQHAAATVLTGATRREIVCNTHCKTLLSNISLRKAVEATTELNAWTPFGHFHLSECSELQQREEPPSLLISVE